MEETPIKAAPTYDIIFAGGGAAACVTAGRLARADPSLKILILEAGPHTLDVDEHIQPGRYFGSLAKPSATFSYHVAQPSKSLADRSVLVPSGRCLGGGSSVNFLVYARAAASDYDDWENVHGNKGWGSKDLIPLLKKVETFQSEILNDTHGTSGPIKVSYAKTNINLAEDYMKVMKSYEQVREATNDIGSFHVCNTYGTLARYIDSETGRRSDAAHNFIYNLPEDTNLTVMVNQRVVRIIFEGTRAVGVEYVDDTVGRANGGPNLPQSVFSSRLVVLSSGAFGSPAILERSGIGAKEILQKNDIRQIVDLPGVGEHYMGKYYSGSFCQFIDCDGYLDHNSVFSAYVASEDTDTLDLIFRGNAKELEPHVQEWQQNGQGLMSHNGIDAGIRLRPTAEELQEMGHDFEKRWNDYYAKATDKPVILTGVMAGTPDATRGASEKFFSMMYFSSHPISVGRVHITGQDPYARQAFEPGFLNARGDLLTLRWAYKLTREIARRIRFFRGEVAVLHPEFSPDSKARVVSQSDGPPCADGDNIQGKSADIRYSAEDDEAIDQFHRKTAGTTWHSAGTCAMKPRDHGGVTDERLNVYGVQGLKVADCSIAPGNVGGNMYNTALAIGEKAAVIICEDLGIKGI